MREDLGGTRPTDPRVRRSRAAVLDAARSLVVQRGVGGTTIEAVAERSGVAKTTIYRHWADQPALVLEALTTELVDVVDPDSGSLRDDLVLLLTGLARALRDGPAAHLMAALLEAAERDPAYARLHRAEAEARHRVVLEVLTRGVARGDLPEGTALDDVLDLLTGPLYHRRWISGSPALDETFAQTVVDTVLAGLRAR